MERFTVLPAYVKDLYSFKDMFVRDPWSRVLGEYQINTFAEITLLRYLSTSVLSNHFRHSL